VCARCDVREECLSYALREPQSAEFGAWGGTPPRERRQLTARSLACTSRAGRYEPGGIATDAKCARSEYPSRVVLREGRVVREAALDVSGEPKDTGINVFLLLVLAVIALIIARGIVGSFEATCELFGGLWVDPPALSDVRGSCVWLRSDQTA
jgi:hypothetical protein